MGFSGSRRCGPGCGLWFRSDTLVHDPAFSRFFSVISLGFGIGDGVWSFYGVWDGSGAFFSIRWDRSGPGCSLTHVGRLEAVRSCHVGYLFSTGS